VRRAVPRRRRSRPRSDAPNGSLESASDARWNAELTDFDPTEFAEFLDADEHPVPADPAFRERLRQQLWTMVRDRADRSPKPGPGGRSRTPLTDPKLRR
jgi:hypothetical protein